MRQLQGRLQGWGTVGSHRLQEDGAVLLQGRAAVRGWVGAEHTRAEVP